MRIWKSRIHSQIEAIIGLEVHLRLKGAKKLFSNAEAYSFSPNSPQAIAPFDCAVPGSLPVINPECIELATKAALALQCKIASKLTFDRKHYFYPDLPNGYQITQYFNPFAVGGKLDLVEHDGLNKPLSVPIEQIQIEQDSAKSIKTDDDTLLDMNRAGMGIIEIVTKPELRSSEHTVIFLKKLHQLMWYHGVTDANMDDGSFRCDVNISVRNVGNPLGNRIELKHLHKFSAIASAIDFEIERQSALLKEGKPINQETRGFDLLTGESFILREKEGTDEYYFIQDADIPDVNLPLEYISRIEKLLPENLDERRRRLHQELGLSLEHVDNLMSEPGAVEYFEQFLILLQSPNYEAKSLVNWVTGELMGMLHKEKLKISESPVGAEKLAALVDLVLEQKVSGILVF
ncbi:hypothetical protein HK103_003095 [Boothiomyces macroporosus]|uniref:Uncharacterized protein n=1 Tax=Boothiomyces macroporosus TaxID=261099 RepID=A0AAD5UMP9_9FUNG|nr:hypothetical protein HK103_003095 [Boothiomyces macroporosus]